MIGLPPRQTVNLSLNEDLVRCASRLTGNLSGTVETLLAEFIESEHARWRTEDARLDGVLPGLNRLYAEHGSVADDFSPL